MKLRVPLEAQIAMLVDAPSECVEDMEGWAGYATEYFRVKHHLSDDVAKYRGMLVSIQPATDAFVARIKAEALERYANQLLESVTHDDSANHEVEDMKQIIAEHMLGRADDLRKGKE